MIQLLMDFALRRRVLVLGAAVLLLIGGVYAFHNLDIEAYPDPIQPRVEITTQPAGWSAEEVEKLVTIPLEWGLAGVRHLQAIRTISIFGVSDVKLYFDWESDYYWDRTETLNRLGLIQMPPGVQPAINPDNPIGEVVRYTVKTPDHDLYKEKEIQDWILRQQIRTVPGVEDVSSFGGLSREYHVDVDAGRLSHYGTSLPALNTAIANANINVGGSYLTHGDQAMNVRGIGFIRSLDDIGNVTLTASQNKATPIRVRDVADVSVGHAPRQGAVGKDQDDDAVMGVVLMRKYGDTLKTIEGVKRKIEQMRSDGLLPPGLKIDVHYDRTGLVHTTLDTVFENLAVGMVLVFLVLLFFLGDLRTALIAAANIPLAMCGAFLLLWLTGTPANLLSLGAVDFGIIIDSTIIVVENIFRHLAAAGPSDESKGHLILRASSEVGGPMFYSTLIFVIAFLPLFTMKGVEGVIFSPMSHTYAFALIVAILLAVTLTPVLSSYFLKKGIQETHNAVWETFHNAYHNLFVRILEKPKLTLAVIGGVIAATLALFPFLGAEFLPKLEEGNIWARATLPLTVSFDRADDVARGSRRIFLSFPEVERVNSQMGRPDDASDVVGFYNIEYQVDLKPRSKWPRGVTKEKLIAQMNARLKTAYPEADFGYSQYIEDNVEEALSGVKGVNAIKVYGPDLAVDEQVANDVNAAIKGVRGIVDTTVYRALGQPNLLIIPDRKLCSRYGLNVGDVNAIVQAAIGGQVVTAVYEGERQFPLVVRWKPEYRQGLDAIRQIRVALPGGGYIPLAQVAEIKEAPGASFIYRERLRRYVPLRFGVRDRDMASAVEEAKRAVEKKVKLPEGVSVDWVGEYSELQKANRRLMVVVPLALAVIMGILYAATTSFANTLILMAQVPVACLGGVLALAVTRTPFSVSAAVGFISIFAIAIMDGILLNFYIHQLWRQGHSVVDSIVMGADRRFRAVMMTALVDGLGLLPMALSTRIGAQTQRPLAIVVIGGAVSIALLTRVFQPTLVYLFHDKIGLTDDRRPESGEDEDTEPAV